ncbi:MAG: XrtA/PEP-CTERM system-associated ATPase [Amphiplicatus sp.]
MYEEYFSFAASPFRLNPDPKFFFGSRSHNKAMAYLHYGIRQGEGFIVITGEIGAGKSMLIGHLLDQLDRSNVVAAHLLTANVEPSALLSHILSAFRIEPSGAGKSAELEALEDFLFDQMNRGRRVLLIVDEAQNLPIPTIEELRMLSNMDYDGTPLFQVFLVGQPEFRAVLAKPEMEQLRQRVIASYHLEPLGLEETTDYIRHRLGVVGWRDNPAIAEGAFAAIFDATGGVPRKINKLCNRIFLYCSIEKLTNIDDAVVRAVVADLGEENLHGDAEDAAVETPIERKRAVGDNQEPPRRSTPAAPMPVVIPFESAKKVTPKTPLEKGKASEEAAPVVREAPSDASASVFDRLRARRKISAAAAEPATLNDVAKAIAAATASENAGAPDDSEISLAEDASDLDVAAVAGGGRRSVAKVIEETRDELKAAHAGLSQINRALGDFDRARAQRTKAIADGLARAEAMIADLRHKGR